MRLRLLSTGLASLTLLLLPIPAADAQQLHLDDTVGDVARVRRDGTFVSAGRATYPDLASVVAGHRRRSITLLARYRDLRPAGVTSAFNLTLATPDGTRVPFDVITEPGVRDGYIEPHEGVGVGDFFCTDTQNPDRRYPQWDVDYRRDAFRIRVPRTCLGRPEWVRVGFVSAVDQGPRGNLYDVPGQGRVRPPFDGSPPSLSEPLYRD
jgi:hypothetical protein